MTGFSIDLRHGAKLIAFSFRSKTNAIKLNDWELPAEMGRRRGQMEGRERTNSDVPKLWHDFGE